MKQESNRMKSMVKRLKLQKKERRKENGNGLEETSLQEKYET